MFKIFKRRPPKQIRFVDTDGNLLFLLPDGGGIVVTKRSGEQFIHICRYVNEQYAEFDFEGRSLRAFAEECRRTGAAFAPEPAPEFYDGYRIVRKVPVPGNIIALGRDLGNYWRYVTLERSQERDGYDYPYFHTEGWKANKGFDRRVMDWQGGNPPRPPVPQELMNRGDGSGT